MTRRSLLTAKIGTVVLVVVALASAYRLGVFAEISHPGVLAEHLVAMGAWGFVAFVAAYAAFQPFGVPGTVFIVAASLIWPWPTAFALSMVGTMCATLIGFSFARFVARDWVSARIPARFRKYDEAIERRAFRTVVLLRLIFWMSQALHAFLGVSRVRFWTHFWGSLLGYVPPILLVSYLGSEMFDATGHIHPRALPMLFGLVVLSVLVGVLGRLLTKRHGSRAAERSSAQ